MYKKGGYVYILTNERKTVLYIGVTSNISHRITSHKEGRVKGFTQRYNVCVLVYCEYFESIEDAIQAEKTLKKWDRKRKERLITKHNPEWRELIP